MLPSLKLLSGILVLIWSLELTEEYMQRSHRGQISVIVNLGGQGKCGASES